VTAGEGAVVGAALGGAHAGVEVRAAFGASVGVADPRAAATGVGTSA
jgi:hypothetical protein